ncbi:MAG TPA: CHAT domain-containing protein [Waterburya sp.]
MKPITAGISSLLTSLLVVSVAAPKPVWGQPIQSAADGTDTIVTSEGSQFNISGGTRSGDGANLFQSFQQFGLDSGQVANFLSTPEIRNILGRVVGGNPSVINGLIQVTGGNPNLFLMNPAGIFFGADARLNVPADFTATTATGIGFGGDKWFYSTGENDYQTLIGTPSQFAFDITQPATLTNEGSLAVPQGQKLSLLSGSITNTGKLTAPSGAITVAAVPGENLVKISQQGHLLSLEIAPRTDADGQGMPIRVQDLPAMLTGNNGHVLNQGQLSTTSNTTGGTINLTGRVVENRGQISANGNNGGTIQIDTKNLLDAGGIRANGTAGDGGEIRVNYNGAVVQTASAQTEAKGSTQGGLIEFNGTANTVLTTSGTFDVTGDVGGTVHLFGQDLRLLAAKVDATGDKGGGEILVGGDYQGGTQGALNAQTTFVNPASTLSADSLNTGDGGKIIVWSDQKTDFYGNLTARGGMLGGNGGLMEVSSKNQLTFGGMANASAANGQAGQLLLDPKNITIDATTSSTSFQLLDPHPAQVNRFGEQSAVLSNGNIVVSSPFDSLIAPTAGAVYLFNPNTGALLSSINGANANDRFGLGLITALPNGNYVFGNFNATIGGRAAAGTVILANGSTGALISQISGANADDRFGNSYITALANGNYVFGNPSATIGGTVAAGTVILANGSTGALISQISGANANDFFGGDGNIRALPNGNYVFGNPFADIGGIPDAGTVILANGSTGALISQINGANANDRFGDEAITVLANGNYVFGNPNATISGIPNAGTVILANGNTGAQISQINGANANDRFGSGNIRALANGNYVFGNSTATIGGRVGAGTVILANGSTGALISQINGANPGDQFGIGDITVLANGNYVFGNYPATIGGRVGAGTVILANGSTGALISQINGANAGDSFGNGAITALANGNYVFGNFNATIEGRTNAGTVILANGSTGALISQINGANPGDRFGDAAITASANGNYMFGNPFADIDGRTDAGTVILANGSTGAQISQINGANAGDSFGIDRITALANGNYLITNPDANSEAGRVDIGIANPNSLTYGYFPNQNITISPQLITQVTNTGTAVTLQANNDITVNSPIITFNPIGNGGDLTFQAGRSLLVNANIITDNGNLTLFANDSTANGVVNAQRDPGNAVITVAPNAALNSGTGNTTLTLGTGAGLTNNASGSITTGNIITDGGNITLTSSNGITTGILSSLSNGSGGAIALSAAGNISTKDIVSSGQSGNGANISLNSGGTVATGILQASGNNTGGNITLNAASNITTNSILSAGGNGNGGSINLNSGGEINLTNDSTTNQSGISTLSGNGNGGDISLKAARNINTGSRPLLSSSAISNGGNITLNSASGNIQVTGIQAEGGTGGNGGTVDITTTGFFRATNSFPNLDGTTASIATGGGNRGGAIIIRHGGLGITPFIVGNASTNGTAGAITTGNFLPVQTISPTREFYNTHTQDGIQIISVPGQTLQSPTPVLGSNRPNSTTIPQDILANLVGELVGAKTTINPDSVGSTSRYGWTINEGNLNTSYINLQNLLAQGNLNQAISQIDETFEEELENYLGEKLPHEQVTVEGIRTVLKTINSETKTQPAIIYALSTPQQLELVLVRPDGPPIHKVIPEANAAALKKTLDKFRSTVTNPTRRQAYLASAQQLYHWLIAPLKSDLDALGIDTLIFCMDAGLRTIPMAALHDGKQFLIEKYSIGSIPSVSLTNSRYKALKNTEILGMGASKFQQLQPLPAVPVELEVITQELRHGKSFLNQEFTLNNLKSQRQPIIHLATHANFPPKDARNAYIQLWDTQLRINQLRQMGWHQLPQVELLTLSACRTAIDDTDAELGFAGLAVQAGVKSALASLWSVNDGGTLALMSEFYHQLSQADVTTKAEALRRAQLAMLRGESRLENGQLHVPGLHDSIPVPPELPEKQDFSHPYYWAAFTMIGSPW